MSRPLRTVSALLLLAVMAASPLVASAAPRGNQGADGRVQGIGFWVSHLNANFSFDVQRQSGLVFGNVFYNSPFATFAGTATDITAINFAQERATFVGFGTGSVGARTCQGSFQATAHQRTLQASTLDLRIAFFCAGMPSIHETGGIQGTIAVERLP